MDNDARLSLYHFGGCPWCERVRAAVADLKLDIEERDVRANPDHAHDLKEAMGRGTVPVLRTDSAGRTDWLPESADIVSHLYLTYGQGKKPGFFASTLPQRLGIVLGLVFLTGSFFTNDSTRVWMLLAAGGFWIIGNRAPFFRKMFH